jgi:Major tropism determinant N-terminal domain
MAIVQISQITNRKGLQTNLPQLAGAELGWSTDTRKLYIGNGTLADGAPVIGNTEILTEFSNISALFSNANSQSATQSQFSQGSFTRLNGQTVSLLDNTASPTPVPGTGSGGQFTIDTSITPTFSFDYSIVRGQTYRVGTWRVASAGSATLVSADNGIENASTGVTISISQTLTTITVKYTTSPTGTPATFNYSVYFLA